MPFIVKNRQCTELRKLRIKSSVTVFEGTISKVTMKFIQWIRHIWTQNRLKHALLTQKTNIRMNAFMKCKFYGSAFNIHKWDAITKEISSIHWVKCQRLLLAWQYSISVIIGVKNFFMIHALFSEHSSDNGTLLLLNLYVHTTQKRFHLVSTITWSLVGIYALPDHLNLLEKVLSFNLMGYMWKLVKNWLQKWVKSDNVTQNHVRSSPANLFKPPIDLMN